MGKEMWPSPRTWGTMAHATILIVLLAVASLSAERPSSRPRDTVIVVAPLSDAERHHLQTTMPVQLNVSACDTDAAVIRRRRHGRQADGPVCDCPRALDAALRRLARWGRDARGMASAVVTAINPSDASAEPIVTVTSLPFHGSPYFMRHREPLLTSLIRKRRLLWQDENEESDLENSHSENSDDGRPSQEDNWDDSPSFVAEENKVVQHDTDSPQTELPEMRSPQVDDSSEVVNKFDPIILDKAETVARPDAEKDIPKYPNESLEKDVPVDDWREQGEITGGNDTLQQEQHNQTAKENTTECGHKPCERCRCEAGGSHGEGSMCAPKANAKGALRPQTAETRTHLPLSDVNQLYLRELLRAIGEGRWENIVRPWEGIPTGQAIDLPPELLLLLSLAVANPADLPKKTQREDNLDQINKPLAVSNPEAALVTATRLAMERLGSLGRKHGSLLIVRSLAPLASKEFSGLLNELRAFGFDAFNTEDNAEHLLTVVEACPKRTSESLPGSADNMLHVFAQGAGAETLRQANTLEELSVAVKNAIRTPVKRVAIFGRLEEASTVRAPEGRATAQIKSLRFVRYLPTRCGGFGCMYPSSRLHRQQSLTRGNFPRALVNKERETIPKPSTDSDNGASMKKKRGFPDPFWQLLEEMADRDNEKSNARRNPRAPRHAKSYQNLGDGETLDDKSSVGNIMKADKKLGDGEAEFTDKMEDKSVNDKKNKDEKREVKTENEIKDEEKKIIITDTKMTTVENEKTHGDGKNTGNVEETEVKGNTNKEKTAKDEHDIDNEKAVTEQTGKNITLHLKGKEGKKENAIKEIVVKETETMKTERPTEKNDTKVETLSSNTKQKTLYALVKEEETITSRKNDNQTINSNVLQSITIDHNSTQRPELQPAEAMQGAVKVKSENLTDDGSVIENINSFPGLRLSFSPPHETPTSNDIEADTRYSLLRKDEYSTASRNAPEILALVVMAAILASSF